MPPTAIPVTSNSTRLSVDALYRVRLFSRPSKDSSRPRLHRCSARPTKKENTSVTETGDNGGDVQVDGFRKELSWAPQASDEVDAILGSIRSGRRSKKLQESGEPDESSVTEEKPISSTPALESQTQPVAGYKEVDGSMVKDSGWLGGGMRWYLLLTRYRREQSTTDYLMAEIPKLPPLADANGKLSERKFSVWYPTKASQAWNTRTKKMGKKTLKYGNGQSVFLECVMDNEIFNLVAEATMIQSFRQKHATMDWVPLPCTDALIQNAYDWIWEDHDVDEQETHRRLEGSEFEAAKDYLFIPDVDVDPQSTDDAVEFIDLVTAGKSVEENAEATRKEREQEDAEIRDRIARKQRGRKAGWKRRDGGRSPTRDDDSRWSKSRDASDRANVSGQDWFEAPAESASSSTGGAPDWASWGQVSDEQSWGRSSDKDLASWDAEWDNKEEEEPVKKTTRDADTSVPRDGVLGKDTPKQEAKLDPPADDDLSNLISDFGSSWGDADPVEEKKQAMGDEESEADIASLFVETWDDLAADTDDVVEFSNDFAGDDDEWSLESSLVDSLPNDDPLERTEALTSPTSKRDEEQIPVFMQPPKRKEPSSQRRKKVEPSVASDELKTGPTESGFLVGDAIAVMSGPFQEFGGKVVSKVSESRIKVELDIFGRPTTVEIDVDSLEKK